MSTESGNDGKKLWIFLVFGLGFFSGFLVSLVVADKLKPSAVKEQAAPATETKVPVVESLPEETAPAVESAETSKTFTSAKSEVEPQEFVMTKEMRDRLLTFDFLKLLQDAEIHRYRFEGETRGIVFKKIRTGSLFEKVGLQDGDVLEEINGIALADIDRRKADFAEQIPGAKQIVLKVRRSEKTVKLKVRIADASR